MAHSPPVSPTYPTPLDPDQDPYHALDGVVWFHPHSNTLIRIGDRHPKRTRRFCITSHVVAWASPVLGRMLFGNNLDSSPPTSTSPSANEPDYLTIPDDDPDYMGILLTAIHCWPKTFENEVSLDKYDDDWIVIFSVIALALKYQCVNALSRWGPEWIRAINSRIATHLPATISRHNLVARSTPALYPTLAAIAFMLGFRKTYENVMTAMVISYPLDRFRSVPPLDVGVVSLAKLEGMLL